MQVFFDELHLFSIIHAKNIIFLQWWMPNHLFIVSWEFAFLNRILIGIKSINIHLPIFED